MMGQSVIKKKLRIEKYIIYDKIISYDLHVCLR